MNKARTLFFFILLFSKTQFAEAQVANFTATPVSGCAPLVVQFTSTSTGSINQYSWDFGNLATSAFQNPSTTYLTPGTYTVKLTVTGPNGTDSKTITNLIVVYPQPTTDFTTMDTAGCLPLTVNFSNTTVPNAPGNMTYSWNFGDGSNTNSINPVHTYTTSGFFNVTLVATNGAGCSKTEYKQNFIHVYQPPITTISTNNPTGCDTPATIIFTANSNTIGPYSYTWDFGDGGSGTGYPVNHTYHSFGVYNISVIGTDGHGCKDTITQNNYIHITHINADFTVNSACPNDTVAFTNTSVPLPLSANWDFGDGGSSTVINPKHIYTTSGTYSVRMIANRNGCIDTVTYPITIYNNPILSFTTTPVQPCPAPVAIQFNNTSTNGVNYTWFFGDGTSSNQPNPLHTYYQNKYDTVKLIAVSSNGCKDSIIVKPAVKIYDLLMHVLAAPNNGCIPLTVHFSDSNTTTVLHNLFPHYPYSVSTYSWSFGDGGTDNSANPQHTYTTAGVYTVKLTINTSNGCVFTDSTTVYCGTPPIADFHALDTVICADRYVTFISPTPNVNLYFWSFGDGGGISGATYSTVTHQYIMPGTYTVKLVVYNNGCPDSISKINYIVVHPPHADFKDSIECPPSKKVWFYNQSIQETSRTYYFGDGQSDTAANPIHTYSALGTYNAYLVAYNAVWGCSDTFRKTIYITNPSMNFTGDTAICKNDSIHLVGNFSGSIPIAYNWLIDGYLYHDTLIHINVKMPITGYHTVSFIVKDNIGCYDTLKKTNFILVAKPIAQFIATPLWGCTPLPVLFTDQSNYTTGTTPATRFWKFGNGTNASTTNVSQNYTYTTAGTYTVTLIVTDNLGCKDTLNKLNYIKANHPTANFTVNDTTTCAGQILTFNNSSNSNSGSLTYDWSFGDGTNSTLPSPTHVYTQVGYYTVRLIVTDSTGCIDTLTRTNYIHLTRPHAAFTLSNNLSPCPPLFVNFTNNSSGAISYKWFFGDGNTATLLNPTNTYSSVGIFPVKLIVFNSQGCTDTANTDTVRILGYAGALSYTPIKGCVPLTVNFSSSISNVPNLIWDFSDGTTLPATSFTATHQYQTPGAYIPKLIFSNGTGCSGSSFGIDTIKVEKITADFKWKTPCIDHFIQLKDSSKTLFSTITNWIWNVNGTVYTGLPTASQLFNTLGVYPVSLWVSNDWGCIDSINKNVTIYPNPIINAGLDTTICLHDSAQLYPTGGTSYLWSPANFLSCSLCANPYAFPNTAQYFTVIGTDAHGCSNADSLKILMQTKTTSTVDSGGAICLHQSFQLQAHGAQTYFWLPNNGSLNFNNIANPIATPQNNTTYIVIAKEGSCIADTQKVNLIVNPLPTVATNGDRTIIAGSSTTLQATGANTVAYLWLSNAVDLSCYNCSNPVATPKATSTYQVIGRNTFGCTDTASVTVFVICDGHQAFIPNTFTPNGDGQNDKFYVRGTGIDHITSMRIYNRWGEKIYDQSNLQPNDETLGWDGTFKGVLQPPDVYVYVVEAICETGEPINWKGDVTLMK